MIQGFPAVIAARTVGVGMTGEFDECGITEVTGGRPNVKLVCNGGVGTSRRDTGTPIRRDRASRSGFS